MSGGRLAFPTIGPSSTWGEFDPSDPYNQRCELERKAATDFTLRRLKRPTCDQVALMLGMMSATVQLVIAGGGESEAALSALHEMLDFSWVQAQSSLTEGGIQ